MKIFHLKSASLPEYRFEWHPETKRVFVIAIGRIIRHDGETKEKASPIAFDIEGPTTAKAAVQAWCFGFKEGQQTQRPLEVAR